MFQEQTRSQRICFAWLPTLPSMARHGRQLPSPARGWRQRWPPAGAPQGVGSSGARDAGYRSWLWACWNPASTDWKLFPADGCLAAGTERRPAAFHMAEAGGQGGGTPGREVMGCPMPGMCSSASTVCVTFPQLGPSQRPQTIHGYWDTLPARPVLPLPTGQSQLCQPQQEVCIPLHPLLDSEPIKPWSTAGLGPTHLRGAAGGSVPSDCSHHTVNPPGSSHRPPAL